VVEAAADYLSEAIGGNRINFPDGERGRSHKPMLDVP